MGVWSYAQSVVDLLCVDSDAKRFENNHDCGDNNQKNKKYNPLRNRLFAFIHPICIPFRVEPSNQFKHFHMQLR